jgi:hypothetical protein
MVYDIVLTTLCLITIGTYHGITKNNSNSNTIDPYCRLYYSYIPYINNLGQIPIGLYYSYIPIGLYNNPYWFLHPY